MFQPAAVIVKGVLVQSPSRCVGPSSTLACAGAAVEDVDDAPASVVVVAEAGLVVVVTPPAPEVVVAPAAAVVVVDPAEPAGGGGV
jgi:hypothetical protein